MTLYFAYGSNLDPAGMARRCPDSVVAGRAVLRDWQLTFRGVADVEPAAGCVVEGLLWTCPPEDMASLDRYEGVAGGFYRRELLEVVTDHGPTVRAVVYVMNATPHDNGSLPSGGYLDSIVRGYVHFGLPVDRLREALQLTEERVRAKGVTSWRDDGRKRLRPTNIPEPVRRGPKKARKRPARRLLESVPPVEPIELELDLGELDDDDLRAMGMTPATIADVRIDNPYKGRRVA
jgi:gamma-glutamylcyclotransferase (GGCT)/AIG2-like uncharacterized protein YtfP